jgi:hypothetical protein
VYGHIIRPRATPATARLACNMKPQVSPQISCLPACPSSTGGPSASEPAVPPSRQRLRACFAAAETRLLRLVASADDRCRIRHAYCGRLPGDRKFKPPPPPAGTAPPASTRRRATLSGVSAAAAAPRPAGRPRGGGESESSSSESKGPHNAVVAAAAAAAMDGAQAGGPCLPGGQAGWPRAATTRAAAADSGVACSGCGEGPPPVRMSSRRRTISARPSRSSARAAATSAREAAPARRARRPATSTDKRLTCREEGGG